MSKRILLSPFIHKLKNYLLSTLGQTLETASDRQVYLALVWALREELMLHWIATSRAATSDNVRHLYYLSMEYLPGKLFGSTIIGMDNLSFLIQVSNKIQRKLPNLLTAEREMAIGNGGLGRLASCLLESLATNGYPAIGYGLRYQYGIFKQAIWYGVQIEKPEHWLKHNPWEFRRDDRIASIFFQGSPSSIKNSVGEEVLTLSDAVEVGAVPFDYPIIGSCDKACFSIVTLRLWSTKESPRNFELQKYNAGDLVEANENMNLTDILYPNDSHQMGKRIRLKQEFLLSSASLEDIFLNYFSEYPDISRFTDAVAIHINETHAALIIPQLMQKLTKDYNLSWDFAWEITRACCNYTNHSILEESLEYWDEKLVAYLLPQVYLNLQRINATCKKEIDAQREGYFARENISIIQNGKIQMATLAILGSSHTNGVSALHTEILTKKLFAKFYALYPNRFVSITNGVSHRKWLLYCNRKLSDLITDCIGDDWIRNFRVIALLQEHATDQRVLERFLQIKRENKKNFSLCLFHQASRYSAWKPEWNTREDFAEEALFDVQVKRIHEYKRQLMNGLHALYLYHKYKKNPPKTGVKRIIIIAGKAAPNYVMAKHIIRFIYCLSRKINNDPDLRPFLKLIFMENYNVSLAERVIPAADLSQQISCAGFEASGTGNMKFAMNGALTIGTRDGSTIEMEKRIGKDAWPFAFGANAEEIEKIHQNGYDPKQFIQENAEIALLLQSLTDRSLTENGAEHKALTAIHQSLLENSEGRSADYFCVLRDFPSYCEAQERVNKLYANPMQWAQTALYNIAGMGFFSMDESMSRYANQVWKIAPSPFDTKALSQLREEYKRI